MIQELSAEPDVPERMVCIWRTHRDLGVRRGVGRPCGVVALC